MSTTLNTLAFDITAPTPTLPLPQGLPEPLDFQDLRQSILSDFMVGTRQWLFNRIDHWITTNPLSSSENLNPSFSTVKLFWLMGGGGTGKSVIISKFLELSLTDSRYKIGAIHYCRHDNVKDSDPSRIVTSIAAQLYRVVPDCYEALMLLILLLQAILRRSSKNLS